MAPKLSQVQNFVYLLQAHQVSVSDLSNNGFDLVVMDYAKCGDVCSEYTLNEIAQIKSGGISGHSKVVLAYMSIGESEDYRFYWEPDWQPGSPAWLGPVNPEWEGNYKVRYWMRGWKEIIYGTAAGQKKSYLDRIIDQGFDGVYLDIIDAYEYWSSPAGGNERTREQARIDMVDFIKELRDYVRVTRGKSDFLIFPQNGADIIYDENDALDSIGQQYLSICDGIGQEDVWYMGTTPQPQEYCEWLTAILDVYKAHGKLVLLVDYLWDAESPDTTANKNRYNDYYTRVYDRGYIPYAANKDRALKDLITVSKGNGFNFDQPSTDCLRVAIDISIRVPCADYLGNPYGFIFIFYRNPDDPSGYYWYLPMATLEAGTGTNCIPIGTDLSIPIPCTVYNGTRFGFTLDFYPNPYDPPGLYWKMDLSTLVVK
jgi:cysteinyl-tRNA synthetase